MNKTECAYLTATFSSLESFPIIGKKPTMGNATYQFVLINYIFTSFDMLVTGLIVSKAGILYVNHIGKDVKRITIFKY